MHATRQWQETGHISPQMLNKWPKPMCGKRKRTNVRRKKIFMEVNLQINKSCSMWQPLWMLSHVGVSLTVICYDYRGVLTYISSLCDISDVCSHITFLPNTSVEPLSEKKKAEGKSNATLHWTISRIQTASSHVSWFYFLGNMLSYWLAKGTLCLSMSSKQHTSENNLRLELKWLFSSSKTYLQLFW